MTNAPAKKVHAAYWDSVVNNEPHQLVYEHSSAYEALIEGRSKKTATAPIVGASSDSILNHLGNVYRNGQGENYNQQIRSLGSSSGKAFAFVSFMFLGVLSVAYIVAFKNYHASLEKLQHLSDMFKNPNARVASGK